MRLNPDDGSVGDLIDHLFRHKAGQMVSTLTRIFGPDHLELAEDVVQESLLKALQQWPYQGVPDNPSAWIVQVAKNRALNVLRREALFRDKAPSLLSESGPSTAVAAELALEDPLGDDQLAMMFMCCHPGLALEAQVALTLKTVSGFSVEEIASAFLLPPATIAQRLVRAKRRLREDNVAFALPPPDVLPARLDAVLAALYLLFSEGYATHHGEDLVRSDLCAEAIRLTRLLAEHTLTRRPRVHALLALMLLQGSRSGPTDDGDPEQSRLGTLANPRPAQCSSSPPPFRQLPSRGADLVMQPTRLTLHMPCRQEAGALEGGAAPVYNSPHLSRWRTR